MGPGGAKRPPPPGEVQVGRCAAPPALQAQGAIGTECRLRDSQGPRPRGSIIDLNDLPRSALGRGAAPTSTPHAPRTTYQGTTRATTMKGAIFATLVASSSAMPQDKKPHCVGECQSGIGARAKLPHQPSLLADQVWGEVSLTLRRRALWPERAGPGLTATTTAQPYTCRRINCAADQSGAGTPERTARGAGGVAQKARQASVVAGGSWERDSCRANLDVSVCPQTRTPACRRS